MFSEAAIRLRYLVERIPGLLYQMDESVFSHKAHPDKWSKKEILGHLMDSATNNHQRFVRAQFEAEPEIRYDQVGWNRFGFYQQANTKELILFWTTYNKHLIHLIENMPEESRTLQCSVGGHLFTLDYLISDYVVHLEHHLKQITDY